MLFEKCKFCRETVKADATKCPHCKKNITNSIKLKSDNENHLHKTDLIKTIHCEETQKFQNPPYFSLLFGYIFLITIDFLILFPFINKNLLNQETQTIFQNIFLFVLILSLRWYYISYKNLENFGIKTKMSPITALVVLFIPIINIFLPYKVMKEIYLGSMPENKTKNNTKMLLAWWITLVFSIFYKIGLSIYLAFNIVDSTQITPNVMILTNILIFSLRCLVIFTTILTALIFRKITNWQKIKRELISSHR